MLSLPLPASSALPRTEFAVLLLVAKATIILAGSLGVSRLLYRSAAGIRHVLWLVTLAALLAVPALTVWGPLHLRLLVAPARRDEVHPALAVQSAASAAPRPVAIRPTVSASARSAPAPGAAVRQGAAGVATDRAATWLHASPAGPAAMLLAIWGAVALVIVASLAQSTLVLRRIVRAGHAIEDAAWRDTLWEVADRLGLDDVPRLLRSDATSMPFACGVLHPTIVLPAESATWTPDRRRAVLLHELAHVRRHDLLGHTLGRVVCALYWFHPLAWTAARRLRSESERACDDLAIACGTRAADYAEHLLEIVTAVRRDRTPLVALAMARRREFDGRMLAILDPELPRTTSRRWQGAALIAPLAALFALVGAAGPGEGGGRAAVRSAPHVARASWSIAGHAADPLAARTRDAAPARPPRAQVDGSIADAAGVAVGAAAASVPHGGARALAIATALRQQDGGSARSDTQRTAVLARLLQTDTSAEVRRVAAWGLSRFADAPTASSALAAALQRDADARVREMAAWALARSGEGAPAARALAVALRHDTAARVRRSAAWALGYVGDRSAIPALAAALADADARVRARAAWALGRVAEGAAPPALLTALGDRDPGVRELAAWALYRIQDPASIAALESALRRETTAALQIADIRALSAMGDRGVAAISAMLGSTDGRTRATAVQALAGGQALGPWPWPWPEPRPYP